MWNFIGMGPNAFGIKLSLFALAGELFMSLVGYQEQGGRDISSKSKKE